MSRRILWSVAASFLLLLTACSGNQEKDDPAPEPEPPQPHPAKVFVHPGVTATADDISRMKSLVEKKVSPAYDAWYLLERSVYAQSTYKMKGPFKVISRNPSSGYDSTGHQYDMTAAYLNALMWVVSGDSSHAKTSLDILAAYSETVEAVDTTKDVILTSGFNTFHMVKAMELLRYTYDVPEKTLASFESMIRNIFVPVMKRDLEKQPYHIGNQDAVGNRGMMAAAIYLNDESLYEWSRAFFLDNCHNGCVKNYILPTTGQSQEMGRDQRHAQLGLSAMAETCELAHKQGDDDLYAAYGNLLLKGFDYAAQYNLGLTVPFQVMPDVTGRPDWAWKTISSEGRGEFLPYYEMVYNHYAVRKKLRSDAEMVLAVLEESRPETALDGSCLQDTYASLVYFNSK